MADIHSLEKKFNDLTPTAKLKFNRKGQITNFADLPDSFKDWLKNG